jgi:hypothetical protein
MAKEIHIKSQEATDCDLIRFAKHQFCGQFSIDEKYYCPAGPPTTNIRQGSSALKRGFFVLFSRGNDDHR